MFHWEAEKNLTISAQLEQPVEGRQAGFLQQYVGDKLIF